MHNVFKNVKVLPCYGNYRAVISWETIPEVASGNFFVLKSIDGINDWHVVAGGQGIRDAIDDNLINQGKMIEQYYKVQVVKNGATYTSNSISTLGTVSREVFGAAMVLMRLEFETMRKFTKLLVCTLRTNANPCHLCVEADTDQAVGTSLCQACWGTKFEGGYFPPVQSYGRFITTSPMVQLDSEDGAGSSDSSRSLVRMLAFPILRKDDMLINAEADKRYLVEDIDYAAMVAQVPVIASVKAALMVTTDVRYKFPIS